MKTLKPFLMLVVMAMLLLGVPGAASAQDYDKGPELQTNVDYYAVIYTNKGEIPLKLMPEKAPKTVRNFVNLAEGTAEFKDPRTGKTAKRPFFNGITFHRVIPNFMIQAGDPTGTGNGGPGFNFGSEFDPELNYDRPGLVGMAHLPGNLESNSSQFFITETPTPNLNQVHTIFGEIVEGSNGLEIVKGIARVDRDPRDKPRNPVVMERVAIYKLTKGLTAVDAMNNIKGLQAAEIGTAAPGDQSSGAAAQKP